MTRFGVFAWIKKTPLLVFFLFWLSSILLFGLIYWMSSAFFGLLTLNSGTIPLTINGFFVALYLSLLAAVFNASILIPSGPLLFLSYLQAACTLIFLFIIVDKIVAYWITPHYATAHLQEKKIHTIILATSIFRSDVDRIMHAMRTKTRSQISHDEIASVIDGLYIAFIDAEKLFSHTNTHRHRMKEIQYFMITENIEASLEKLHHFLAFLDEHHSHWRDKSILPWINRMLAISRLITSHARDYPRQSVKLHEALDHITRLTDTLHAQIE